MNKYTTLFFDLDATLYTTSNGLWERIKERISLYMIERMGIPAAQVAGMRQDYYRKYGTTLAGLQRHYQVDPEEYLNYVHDIPLREYIAPNPKLREMLASLPQARWVFTNSDSNHVERVLSVLGISDLFDGVADVYALDFQVKPTPEAYRRTLAMAGNPAPESCVLFDDLVANIMGAKEMGLYTVLVNPNGSHPKADLQVRELLELPSKMPWLWR
ncbi:MAG: Phosphoglycolate phosphatase [Chloroflexi bacterium]|nr:Phosphoglycolate phosphatase [Chloroflexota bacterium]